MGSTMLCTYDGAQILNGLLQMALAVDYHVIVVVFLGQFVACIGQATLELLLRLRLTMYETLYQFFQGAGNEKDVDCAREFPAHSLRALDIDFQQNVAPRLQILANRLDGLTIP